MAEPTAAIEVNFDGLIGPTHNYAGLARGNLAAAANAGARSNPRAAALQGLSKMRLTLRLGLAQGVLPPHERPHLPSLRRMGFAGDDAAVLAAAAAASPALVANVSSASAMWAANAATVTPSADAGDGRVHLTPANLSSHFHRALEQETTRRALAAIFADEARFVVHEPAPFAASFGDEGAANHCRLAPDHGAPGVELFVWGRSAFGARSQGRFEPRQTLEASRIVAARHGLPEAGAAFARQSRAAVDAGAFHNDVVAVSNGATLIFHEDACDDADAVIEALRRKLAARGAELLAAAARREALSLSEAVASYVFNSQLVTLPDGAAALIAPAEAEASPRARAFVAEAMAAGAFREVHYVDVRESMRNGGGPACLRLRVVLTGAERAALAGATLMDEARLDAVEALVRAHYRDRLDPADLVDPQLLEESRTFLDRLSALLGLGAIHDFQRN